MKHPSHYKTRYGLYRATMRALDYGGFKKVWFCYNARIYCQAKFPDLLPQLEQLMYGYEMMLADLTPTF